MTIAFLHNTQPPTQPVCAARRFFLKAEYPFPHLSAAQNCCLLLSGLGQIHCLGLRSPSLFYPTAPLHIPRTNLGSLGPSLLKPRSFFWVPGTTALAFPTLQMKTSRVVWEPARDWWHLVLLKEEKATEKEAHALASPDPTSTPLCVLQAPSPTYSPSLFLFPPFTL